MFPAGRGCRRRRASRGGARGRDLEGRGEETAADRVAYLGAAVVELAVVLAVAEDDGAGDVAHGASHALRVPGPAGDAISVRQIRGRGGYGARARCVARGRGEGGRGRYARVPSRLFPTSRTSRSPRLAAPRRARACYGSPPRATRNGSLSTTRGSIGAHQFADLPSGGFRRPRIDTCADSATGGGFPYRDEVIVARATCTPATSTARARIRRR